METLGNASKRNLAQAPRALINREQAAMETYSTDSGLTCVFTGGNATQQANFWRPWTGKENTTGALNAPSMHGDLSDAKHHNVIHPVRLYWPKSRCFDYLYREAEMLLRNYPVQATICPYEDSSSDEDSDDEEVEVEKELN
ncbi:protein ripply2 [Anabas testudineus]|uniref:protein ripply2 n=1 Tax=Anabas testudineus TaxID=64144 RepID=UPI000E45E3FA|nr:protein ripply2 [Anabas testudineus]